MKIEEVDSHHVRITAEAPEECFEVGYITAMMIKTFELKPGKDFTIGRSEEKDEFHWVVMPKKLEKNMTIIATDVNKKEAIYKVLSNDGKVLWEKVVQFGVSVASQAGGYNFIQAAKEQEKVALEYAKLEPDEEGK